MRFCAVYMFFCFILSKNKAVYNASLFIFVSEAINKTKKKTRMLILLSKITNKIIMCQFAIIILYMLVK
jgi:hypothetical protein